MISNGVADVVWYKMIPDSIYYRPLNVPRIKAPKKFNLESIATF